MELWAVLTILSNGRISCIQMPAFIDKFYLGTMSPGSHCYRQYKSYIIYFNIDVLTICSQKKEQNGYLWFLKFLRQLGMVKRVLG